MQSIPINADTSIKEEVNARKDIRVIITSTEGDMHATTISGINSVDEGIAQVKRITRQHTGIRSICFIRKGSCVVFNGLNDATMEKLTQVIDMFRSVL